MTLTKNNCYIITGGPGVGKTTLLNALGALGYHTVAENARSIIKEEMARNGDGLPWKNKARYMQLMFDAAVSSYQAVPATEEIYFFDRGILDAICYAEMEGITVSPEMKQLATTLRYHSKVFILPPWQEIYHTDEERKQTWDEALQTFTQMKATYLNYGYQVVEVPKDHIENRMRFVINEMNTTDYGNP